MTILKVEEYLITTKQKKNIQNLLVECFEGYPQDRIYYHQLPHFRLLAYKEDILVGHIAVNYRVITLDKQPYTIFGIEDVCVAPSFRRQEIASTLMRHLENMAKTNVDFILLTGEENPFYKKLGYQTYSHTCRWLMLHPEQTLGINHRYLDKAIIVKPMNNADWFSGLLDFKGTIF